LSKVLFVAKYNRIFSGYATFGLTEVSVTVRVYQHEVNELVVMLELVRVVRRLLQARRALRDN
jgi:hypothetical protein